ncbi:hypothetical protein OFO81_02105, partial [Escherichia coli]|nr:hypothetical protein [Escherichia coli]
MENNDKFLSQDLLESYAIRLLSGPLNGCEYEILNGRLLVIIGNDVGFAPIFPDICYHLTHYKPAAADIPVASDNPAHYADA